MREVKTIEEMTELVKNYNISVKGCFSSIIPYTEMTLMARSFDRDFNRLKRDLDVVESIKFLDKILVEYKEKISKTKQNADSYNYLPCLKKEQDKILKNLVVLEKKVTNYEEMRTFFINFETYSNIEQLFYFLKYNLLRL